MRNRQVPHAEWTRFFETFTREHQGATATVRVVDPRLGVQVEARDMPFEGIAVDPEIGAPIRIQLGTKPPANLDHPIEQPEQIWLELTDRGTAAALEITSGGGRRTILEFSGVGASDARGVSPGV